MNRKLAIPALVAVVAAGSIAYAGDTFSYTITPLPGRLVEKMRDVSWRPGCPVGPSELRLVQLAHWGYDGRVHRGQLVVHEKVAQEVADIFAELFSARFPIAKMRLIENYGGSDDASMADDNTSAFNCRPVTGGRGFSRHAWGLAIDINPLRNPYVLHGKVLPPEGKAWLDRSKRRPGMIVRGDAAWKAFTSRGWRWGGDFRRAKDYQHFDKRPAENVRSRRRGASARRLRCLVGRFPKGAAKISLDEWRTPLAKMLDRIAALAKLNIVTAEGVSGTVTLKLDSVPWPAALDAVLCSLGLRGTLEGNVIFVDSSSN